MRRVPVHQRGLQGLEERFHDGGAVAIALAAHQYPEAVPTQDLLMIVRMLVAAASGMLDAAPGRPAQGDRPVQCPDRQIFLQPVADRPTAHAPARQIRNDSKTNPAPAGPDVADVACPFPVRPVRAEIPAPKVRRGGEHMSAIGRDLACGSGSSGECSGASGGRCADDRRWRAVPSAPRFFAVGRNCPKAGACWSRRGASSILSAR